MTGIDEAPPASNPFSDVTVKDLMLLERLESQFLATAFEPQFFADCLAGRALVSANLFGGLNDPKSWQGWLDAVLKAKAIESHEVLWFEIQRPTGRRTCRLWFPDPVTGTFLKKLRSQIAEKKDDYLKGIDATYCVKHALDTLAKIVGAGLDELAILGPDWLARTCTARLHMRVPSLLAEHASGRTVTHARFRQSPKQQIGAKQLHAFLASAKPRNAWRPFLNDHALLHLHETFFPPNQAAVAARRELGKAMRSTLDKQIDFWIAAGLERSLHIQMLRWLRSRLDPRVRSDLPHQNRIRPATARNYLWVLASTDWKPIRKLSIEDPACIAAITAAFDKMLEKVKSEPAQRQETYRAVVESFSHFLNAANPKIPLYQLVVKPKAKSIPRTDVLDSDQFVALMQMLKNWGMAQNCMDRSWSCQLAAILMFRTGLRGHEVTKLALNDIEFEGGLVELVVRGSAERSNKTIYSRRTLPLHVLLSEAELTVLRQLHARRSDEEFHASPRAKLFQLPLTEPLHVDQYVLEPVDAVVRVLMGQSLSKYTTRREQGYWSALASPLRHSFASHLFATLLLPDDRLNIPMPKGVTADLVSVSRKTKLAKAFLRQDQLGLSVMQAVRQAMGHSGHKRALDTYIHNIDWVLAAHLWREDFQPPLTSYEMAGFLGRTPTAAVVESVGDRQQRRQRAREALRNPGSMPAGRPKRGRPARRLVAQSLIITTARDHFLHHYLEPAAFGKNAADPSKTTVAVDYGSDLGLPDRGWWALHHILKMRGRSLGVEQLAQRSAISADTCQRWLHRATVLSTVVNTNGQCRFPQMSLNGFSVFHDQSPRLLDGLWACRSLLSLPKRWKAVVDLLSRWQPNPPRIRSPKSVIRIAKLYVDLGIPGDLIVMRLNGGSWQRYAPDLLTSDKGQEFQLSAGTIADGDIQQPLHHTVLYGLLMMVIDATGDLSVLDQASALPKGNRPPERLRQPVRRAVKVSVHLADVSG